MRSKLKTKRHSHPRKNHLVFNLAVETVVFNSYNELLNYLKQLVNFILLTSAINTKRFFIYEQHFYKQRQAEIGKKSSKC